MRREDWEQQELAILSPRAAFSARSEGRLRPLPPCSYRTAFQRDRDRIIHSKGFRRLKYKTQVFLPARGDHFRTRLTHTLEVAQIARTAARGLRLNEDLTEAIALGHDLGHTPFGHSGERALAELMAPAHHFRHNEQSLRLVDLLENEGQGLNLTLEVRDGILHHTGDVLPRTLEGQLVRFADRIAYVNHDIDDALRSGLLTAADLPPEPLRLLGASHGERINTLVASLIEHNGERDIIAMEEEIWQALDALRDFLFARLYRQEEVLAQEVKAHKIVTALFHHYEENPNLLPAYYEDEEPVIRIKDYIAGMTDQYAIKQFMALVIPSGIHILEY